MTPKPLRHALLLPLGLIVVFSLTGTRAFADCANEVKPSSNDALQMLVLGDSIMWGQGLREEEKFTSRIKCWLEERTNREVKVHVEAHSGAVISAGSARLGFTAANAEVNLPTPSINEQLDHAIQFYQEERSSPNLILLNGCINDVGVKSLLAASTPLDELRERAQKSCGEDMFGLLQRVRKSFSQSHVIVTSYYPLVSRQTADNAFLRLLVKKLNYQRPETRRQMTDKEIRTRLIAISDEWYKTSTASLMGAVAKINAEAGAGPSSPRVAFVEIQFGPEHVFAAPDTLLWNFMFASTNLSGFRKVIVLLSFGTAAYKANDQMRESRIKSCEQTFKKPKGVKEEKDQKNAREDLFLICRYASLGHPNQMGALIYTEAIKGQLQQIVDKAGWKQDINRTLTLQ